MDDTNQHENGGDTAELLPRQGRNALQPLRVTSPTPPGVGSPQLGTPTWGGDSSIAAATATQVQPAPVTDGHEPVPYYDGQDYKQDGGANGNYAGAHGEAGDASGSDIDDDLAKHLQGAVVAARVSRGEILAEQAADHQYYTQAEIDAYNAANASEYVGDGEEVYTAEDFEHIADDATKWEAWDEEAAAYGVGYAAADEEGGYGDGFGEYDYYQGQDVAADPEAQLNQPAMSSVVQGAALAASFAARIAKRARVKAANVKSVHHRDEEKLECLDWLDHDWVKPSLTKSMAHRSRYVYRGGKAPICSTSLDEIGHVTGYGLALYFHFLKMLAIAFGIMFLLAMPSIIINMSGARVTEESRDPLGASVTSLGNNGYSAEEEARQRRDCVQTASNNCNVTMIEVLGNQITSSNAALMITFFDVLYTVFFLAFISYFTKFIISEKAHHAREGVTAADYSVRVSGLPRDATKEEVLEHFNGLYDLSKYDWHQKGYCFGCCFRKKSRRPPALVNAAARLDKEAAMDKSRAVQLSRTASRPSNSVSPASQTKHARLVAMNKNFSHHAENKPEAAVVDPNDPQPVSDVTNTGDPMYIGKWVNEATIVHANGVLIRRYMALRGRQLKLLRARAYAKKYKTGEWADDKKLASALAKVTKLEKKLRSAKKRRIRKRVAGSDCVAAYVVFNEHTSLVRALEDYERFSGWKKFIAPKPLQFRGKYKLTVKPADNPSNIIWENQDTTHCQQYVRRTVALSIMLLLLAVSVGCIFYATLKKNEAAKRLPNLSLCTTELPARAWNSYDTYPTDAELARNRTADGDCGEGMYYLKYINSPNLGDSCTDPCVSPVDATVCSTLKGDKSYERKVIVGCYCKAALQSAMADKGLLKGAEHLKDTESDLCTTFAEDYLTTQGLLVGAAFSIVVVNALLRTFMSWLAKFERHYSLSAQSSSLAQKIFLGLFCNTGLVTLLVSANLPNLAFSVDGVGLFVGDFNDFTPRWYTVVGVSLVLTMVINTFAPQFAPLFKLLILQPVKQCCCKNRKVTQEGLNALYEGSEFKVATRYPTSLNTLFVSMVYCTGLPILLPIASISFFVSYWIDKISLLRLYSLPPRFDDALARLASKVMPWAALMHTFFAVWMLGQNDILKSEAFNGSFGDENAEEQYEEWKARIEEWDRLGVVPRIARLNVLPMFLLGFALFLWLTMGVLLKPVLRKFAAIPCCCCLRACIHKKQEMLDEMGNPPFTGLYYELIDEYEQQRLFVGGQTTKKDLEVVDDSSHGGRFKIVKEDGVTKRVRVWQNDGFFHGRPHARGDQMYTWEVVAEHGLFSYDILANKVYRRAMVMMLKDQKKGGVHRNSVLASEKARVKTLQRLRSAKSSGSMKSPKSPHKGFDPNSEPRGGSHTMATVAPMGRTESFAWAEQSEQIANGSGKGEPSTN